MDTEVAQGLAQAALARCDAIEKDAVSRLKVYFYRPAAIGEHPQLQEEIDKLLDQAATAHDRREALKASFADLVGGQA